MLFAVIPAKNGTHVHVAALRLKSSGTEPWVPAFAGMTARARASRPRGAPTKARQHRWVANPARLPAPATDHYNARLICRGVAQSGRALRSGRRGRRFE